MNRHERRANASRARRGLRSLHGEPDLDLTHENFVIIDDPIPPEGYCGNTSPLASLNRYATESVGQNYNEVLVLTFEAIVEVTQKLAENGNEPHECEGCRSRYWAISLGQRLGRQVVDAGGLGMHWEQCPCGDLVIGGAWLAGTTETRVSVDEEINR